jgi:hypothetical protein
MPAHGTPEVPTCESASPLVALDGEMKALLVLAITMLVAAATVVAYGTGSVAAEVEAIAARGWTEPATLIFSGSVLLGVASAVRRLPF